MWGAAHLGQCRRIRQASWSTLAQNLILETFAPACVVVNRRSEISTITVAWRLPRAAKRTADPRPAALARPTFRTKLRAALHRAATQKPAVSVAGLRLQRGADPFLFDVSITPVAGPGRRRGVVVVAFVDGCAGANLGCRRIGGGRTLARSAVGGRLRSTREDLHNNIEQLETANEELKAANEEMMSMNEELQSANE